MAYLVAPESLRARWAVAISDDSRAGVAQIDAIAERARGKVVCMGIEDVDTLLLAGDATTVVIPAKAGVVLARAGKVLKGAKWKVRSDLRLVVKEPMALFAGGAPQSGVTLALSPGAYAVAWDEDLVKLSPAK